MSRDRELFFFFISVILSLISIRSLVILLILLSPFYGFFLCWIEEGASCNHGKSFSFAKKKRERKTLYDKTDDPERKSKGFLLSLSSFQDVINFYECWLKTFSFHNFLFFPSDWKSKFFYSTFLSHSIQLWFTLHAVVCSQDSVSNLKRRKLCRNFCAQVVDMKLITKLAGR